MDKDDSEIGQSADFKAAPDPNTAANQACTGTASLEDSSNEMLATNSLPRASLSGMLSPDPGSPLTETSHSDLYDPSKNISVRHFRSSNGISAVTTGVYEVKRPEGLQRMVAEEYGIESGRESESDPRYNEDLEVHHKYNDLPREAELMAASAPDEDGDIASSSFMSPTSTDGSHFWALIIGIDAYKIHPLKGCVSDALSIKEYFSEDLCVPQDHIHCLFNESATRANIVNALCSLSSNQRICYRDIIVIYFAGHGSSYVDPVLWTDEADVGPVEVLCPVDRGSEANGTLIPDISDREIDSILSEISRAKGSRITVILDCCHSGSATRDSPVAGVRTIPPLTRDAFKDMLRAADENMTRCLGYISVSHPDWCPSMDSHVMLAASDKYEYAREVDGLKGFHGVFTYSLVHTLRSSSLTERSTYIDLIFTLPVLPYQTPVVAGSRKDTRVWYQN